MNQLTPASIRILICVIEQTQETDLFTLEQIHKAARLSKSRTYKIFTILKLAGKIKRIGVPSEGKWRIIDKSYDPPKVVEKKPKLRITGIKLTILHFLKSRGNSFSTLEDVKQETKIKGRTAAFALNSLVANRFCEKYEGEFPAYRAVMDEYGSRIEQFPEGTTIEIIDGVRYIFPPAAFAVGYRPM